MRIDAKKRGGSGKRAGPKIEKRQGGKEAREKEPLSRRGVVEKDVEERIGGYLGVPRDAIAPLVGPNHPKNEARVGGVGGGQKKKSKGPNNTGQEGEP